MINRNRLNRFGTAWRAADFLRAALFFCGAAFFSHCMAVNVPEDYVSDLYYPASPGIASLTPSTSMSWTTLSVPVLVKFNKPMDASTVTVNTTDTTCSGSIQITTAADNFTTACLQFSSLTATTRNSVFSAALTADLDPNSNYIIKVIGTVTDFQGKTLGADATYAFKSGVPSGTEPRVLSVTSSGGFSPGFGNLDFIVTFSRQMTFASIGSLGASSCSEMFNFSNDNFVSDCNVSYNSITPAGDSTTYTIRYKNQPSGTYVFKVKQGLIDKFGIATQTDYTVNYP